MSCFKMVRFLVLFTLSIQGQEFVEFEGADFEQIKDHQLTEIILFFKVKEGFYIQSESPKFESFVATKFWIEEPISFEVLKTIFSNGINRNEQDLIEDTFSITLILKGRKESSSKPSINGALTYQACSKKQCFYPRTLDFQIK